MPHRFSPRQTLTLAAAAALLLAGCGELPVAEGLKRAQADLDAGRTPQALARLEAMHQKNPADTAVTEALAFAQMNAGDAAQAGELFKELGLQKDPDNHLYAAQAYKKAGQNEKAIEAYRLYLLSEPKQATPWTEMGEMLIASGNKPEGIAALAKAGEIDLSPELAERIGGLYMEQHNAMQAQRYLQNALKQSRAKRGTDEAPAELEGKVLEELATLALAEKKTSEAERHLKQLERDFPKNEKLDELKKKLAELSDKAPPAPRHVKKPKTDKQQAEEKALIQQTILPSTPAVVAAPEAPKPNTPADAAILDALQKHKDNPALWMALGAEKAKSQDWVWAESAYLEAMRLRPNDEAAILAYLGVAKERRSPVEFLREAESLLEKHTDLPGLYLITARGYRELMQNKRNATIIFNRFLKKFPTHPEAAKVKAELEGMK